ncbi:hypothetical protein ALI144C_04110 [Actinosynnema sp. ALI-1.44]|uniref:hypothetical protein n=1 Tax=Actinosynnema sp. ALI-1.44 TaxID=1933779 RepID=UPI00097CBF74|nr:hypothetical protein [Actinosynnema sp. ALI-1.44]ONI89881.1 hypothetical protein ALI144C_04110 [Actinosynnema sp. ALI-1.44]
MTTVPSGRRGQSRNHIPSHQKLITRDPVAEPAEIDAIVVPTARPARYLSEAIRLAQEQDCVLVVLCSKRARAESALWMARPTGIRILAVDVDLLAPDLLPDLTTSAVIRGSKFDRPTDTSMKRNFGLLLAQVAGWKRIVFLDDDIEVPRPRDLEDAVGLLDDYAGAGLSIGGFSDNSVVCHAFRDAGGDQDTFIGGGALAVGHDSYTSFFPKIYNEDWFFLLDEQGLRPSAITGEVVQARYDPYRDDRRARSEELGDSLAEGLFALLTTGRELAEADKPRYWRTFLTKRRSFIEEVIGMVGAAQLHSAQKARMIVALKAARGRNWLIEPELCVAYLRAWRADRVVWRRFVEEYEAEHAAGGLEKLLADIGLMHCYGGAV